VVGVNKRREPTKREEFVDFYEEGEKTSKKNKHNAWSLSLSLV